MRWIQLVRTGEPLYERSTLLGETLPSGLMWNATRIFLMSAKSIPVAPLSARRKQTSVVAWVERAIASMSSLLILLPTGGSGTTTGGGFGGRGGRGMNGFGGGSATEPGPGSPWRRAIGSSGRWPLYWYSPPSPLMSSGVLIMRMTTTAAPP